MYRFPLMFQPTYGGFNISILSPQESSNKPYMSVNACTRLLTHNRGREPRELSIYIVIITEVIKRVPACYQAQRKAELVAP